MPITKSDNITRTFFLGFIRLHILYHASRSAVFGLELIHELERHGYHLSPGTLYPILHSLERDGYLSSERQLFGGKVRVVYRATSLGEKTLSDALEKVRQLIDEISPPPSSENS